MGRQWGEAGKEMAPAAPALHAACSLWVPAEAACTFYKALNAGGDTYHFRADDPHRHCEANTIPH